MRAEFRNDLHFCLSGEIFKLFWNEEEQIQCIFLLQLSEKLMERSEAACGMESKKHKFEFTIMEQSPTNIIKNVHLNM